MDLIHSSDARIVFAFWVGVCVVVMALLMLVAILVMRQLAARAESRHLRATEFWRRVLTDAMRVPDTPVPPLRQSDVPGFVDAWNDLHEAPENRDNPGMRAVAGAVGLERQLSLALQAGGFHDRVMSMIAMGHLKCPAHLDTLVAYLEDGSTMVSITAARAIMRIDPRVGVEKLIPQIVAHQDWVQGNVAVILGEAGAGIVSRRLGEATLQVNDAVAPRMVRLLADVSPRDAAPVIRALLSGNHDEHLTSTCLQVLAEPSDLDVVRPLLQHPRWHVRMHAATALGRLGGEEDRPRLLPLLSDSQWWVRYRAAQALARLFSHDIVALGGVRDAQEDRFARDILVHVLAEIRMKGARV